MKTERAKEITGACLLGVSHRLISSQAKVKQDQGGTLTKNQLFSIEQ